MPKTPTAVFKCLQPDLIEANEQRTAELFAEYREKFKALRQEWGVAHLSCRSDWDGGQYVTGYIPANYEDAPKPGFRKDRDTGFMLPAKRTSEGKAIAQRLKDVHYKPGKQPGLPSVVMGEGFMGPMTLRKLSGTWYASCTVPLREGDAQNPHMDSLREVDRDIWAPAKLSEYFIAAEAEGEAPQ